MKKVILIFAFLIAVNTAFAGQYTPTLGKIENVLYGFQYDNETDELRLDRIENTVYGNPSSGNISQRMTKLKNDLSADLMGQEITPKEDTFSDDKWIEEEPVADANIEYPAVDELEQKVFNQKFTNKDIKQRLTALEEKTFGQTFTDDLSSRVDRLKAELKPHSFMGNEIAQSSNNFFDEDVIELDRDYHLDRYESPNQFDYDAYNAAQNSKRSFLPHKKAGITTVENSVLRRSFQNDTMKNRLARLESAMFGTEFSYEDDETRMNRISSAYRAQKSASKYDSNKFSQNMATAVQIGSMILMILACIL